MSPPNTSRNEGFVASNTDLAAVAGYVTLAAAVLALAGDLPTAVALPLALPVVLFAPGYAVVTAIVPETTTYAEPDAPGDRFGVPQSEDGLSTVERLTLSVVASIAVVPLVALAVDAVVGVALGPVLAGVAAVTLVAAVAGAVRRGSATLDPLGGGSATGPSRSSGLLDGVPTDAITLGCAAVAVLMLVSSAGLALTGGGAVDTEFYLVEETADGEYVATGYTQTLTQGSAETFTLGLEHDGATPRQYTVVALLEEREGTGGDATVASHELGRYDETVAPGDDAVRSYDVTPTAAGEDLTLTFLCYRGEAPDDPSRTSAHRAVSLPVDVTRG